jgi:hypothetical protein
MDAQEAITDVGEVMGAGEEPGGSPDHQHANGASSSGLPAASEEASEEEPIRKRCVQAAPGPIVAPPLFLSAAGCLYASPDQHATIVPLHAPCNVHEPANVPACRLTAARLAVARRLWFLRMPRPSVAGSIKSLEQELETFRAQYNLITESLNVKKVCRLQRLLASPLAQETTAPLLSAPCSTARH